MILFRFRLNIGQAEKTYGLTSRELLIGRGSRIEKRIPLAEITGVNLQTHGEVFGQVMYRCVIRTRHEKILLSNLHYRGLARIEGRNREYRRFVLALHQVLSRRSCPVLFETGHPAQALLGAIFVAVTPLVLIAASAVWIIKGTAAAAGVGAIGLGSVSTWAWQYAQNGKRAFYDPRFPPSSHLPQRSLTVST